MATPRKRSSYARAAEQLLAQRVDLVDDAGKAYQELTRFEAEAAERIATLRQAYAERYAAAVEGGWTPAQLEAVELPAPDGGAGKRRRSSRRARPAAASSPAVDAAPVDEAPAAPSELPSPSVIRPVPAG